MFTASHTCYLNRHKIVLLWKLRYKHRGQRWLSLNVSACGAHFIQWLQLKVKTASISNNTLKCCFTLNLNEKMLCSHLRPELLCNLRWLSVFGCMSREGCVPDAFTGATVREQWRGSEGANEVLASLHYTVVWGKVI